MVLLMYLVDVSKYHFWLAPSFLFGYNPSEIPNLLSLYLASLFHLDQVSLFFPYPYSFTLPFPLVREPLYFV